MTTAHSGARAPASSPSAPADAVPGRGPRVEQGRTEADELERLARAPASSAPAAQRRDAPGDPTT